MNVEIEPVAFMIQGFGNTVADMAKTATQVKRLDRLTWGLACIIYAAGLGITIMDVEASRLAVKALNLASTNSYLEAFLEYTSTSPLLVILTSLVIQVLGNTTLAYKLIAFSFSGLGVWSTYQLGSILYTKRVGNFAALILITTSGFLLTNNDIRTETVYIGVLAFNAWQTIAYLSNSKKSHLFLSVLSFTGLLFTDGSFGIAIPFTIAIAYTAIKKVEWSKLTIYLSASLLFSILSASVIYSDGGFDAIIHFLWFQNFEALSLVNIINQETTTLFYTHTFLWSFCPWMLMAIPALYSSIENSRNDKMNSVLISTIALPFLLLCLTHFDTPQYLFVIYPFVAILTSKYLIQTIGTKPKLLALLGWFQYPVILLLLTLSAIILFYEFNTPSPLVILIWLVSIAGLIYAAFTIKDELQRLAYTSMISGLSLFIALNMHFYPGLMEFQSGSKIADYIQSNHKDISQLHFFETNSDALSYYLGSKISDVNQSDIESNNWIITTERGLEDLKNSSYEFEEKIPFQHYHVTELSIPFLNPKTRHFVTEHQYLLQVK